MPNFTRPSRRSSSAIFLLLMLAALPMSADAGVLESTLDTRIVAGPDRETTSTAAHFEFTSNVQGATFECRLDGRFVPCGTSADVKDLEDGRRTFTVAAIDRAGNQDEQPASWTWTVDTTGPTVLVTQSRDFPRDAARAVFEIESEPGARFECQLDDGEPAACTSPIAWSGLKDGTHKVTVRGWDHLGNTGPAASVTWTVDTTTPDTTITSGPSLVSGPSTAFTFRSTKPGATFECALDDAEFTMCSSPTPLARLGGGIKRWRVRAISPGGTVDPTPATRTWIVDATGPIVNITGGPSAGSTTASTAATFTLRVKERFVTFRCSLDGAMPASCSARERRTGLALGPHTFRVIAVDRFGNEGPPATRRWVVVARGR